MKLIVGLGNPGEQYEQTRHNLGFLVLDRFLKDITPVKESIWELSTKMKSKIFLIEWQPKKGSSEKVLLAKPNTFMNNSGKAVQLLADFYKIESQDIWVVHDDLDLPLGKLKIRFGGAGAGHHGIENIMTCIGTDKFWRFRLGIGNPRHTINRSDAENEEKMISRRHLGSTTDFVLGVLEGKEWSSARKLVKDTVESLEVALENGLESAMNRFNTK